jgi:hypothetical protein
MPLINQNKFVASVASGHTSTSMGPTDICKTPTPPGPGVCTKTLSIATPIYTKNSKIGLSNGDQPGVALGVVSNKIMGMVEMTMTSNDVDAEGGGVARTLDSTNANI